MFVCLFTCWLLCIFLTRRTTIDVNIGQRQCSNPLLKTLTLLLLAYSMYQTSLRKSSRKTTGPALKLTYSIFPQDTSAWTPCTDKELASLQCYSNPPTTCATLSFLILWKFIIDYWITHTNYISLWAKICLIVLIPAWQVMCCLELNLLRVWKIWTRNKTSQSSPYQHNLCQNERLWDGLCETNDYYSIRFVYFPETERVFPLFCSAMWSLGPTDQ